MRVSVIACLLLVACQGGGTAEESHSDETGVDAAEDAAGGDASADAGDDADADGATADAADSEPLPPDPAAAATPIEGAVNGAATLLGNVWVARAFETPFSPPEHPFMARNPGSNIHNDPWMSDVYPGPGPLGNDPVVRSNEFTRLCATLTFDSRGRIVSTCVGLDRPRLMVLDPETLGEIASFDLPARAVEGAGGFSNFSGGGYFYLDHRDRAVIPTSEAEIWVVGQRWANGTTTLELEESWDLRPAIGAEESVQSAIPDFAGRIWFVTQQNGIVGFVEPESGRITTVRLGEPIANSFAVDADGGVYIATDVAMYRMDVVADEPAVTWRHEYDNTGEIKPGQVSAGTGTTPTLLDGGLVAIVDNADPVQVVVYRTRVDATQTPICEVPVFGPGRSATENSLIGAGRTLVIENNYGYEGPELGAVGPVTETGFARVDVREDGTGCDRVWQNAVMAPSSVPKLSLETGLIYAVGRPTPEAHDWSFVAIDVESGMLVWEIPIGEGVFLNNNYAGVALGPTGTLYVGVLGGIVSLTAP
jgi:hypothetical protein